MTKFMEGSGPGSTTPGADHAAAQPNNSENESNTSQKGYSAIDALD